MNLTNATEHGAIAELLPDYALGRLDDGSASRVSGHLRRCASCRQEFDHALDVLGALAAEPPPDWVRGAILWQATEGEPKPPAMEANGESPPARLSPVAHAPTPFGKPLPRLAVVAASLAV